MTLRVGIVGTGYAAQKRAAALGSAGSTGSKPLQACLVAVAGEPARAAAIAQPYGAQVFSRWQHLLAQDIDLVFVTTISARHGDVVEAALVSGRHVVVEYPLSLNLAQANALAQLATERQLLLHVEHIELLGGLHQAAKGHLAQLGQPQTARYTTLAPQHPAPKKWSYRLDLGGFPLVSALSRVSRMVDLFGSVTSVICQTQFDWGVAPYYRACLCEATLQFACGVTAELIYGKGERDWPKTRCLELWGTEGQLLFEGDQGYWHPARPRIGAQLPPAEPTQVQQAIPVQPRRGLFLQDTQQVIDHLMLGTPLWPPLAHSLTALTVADALHRSAEAGQPVTLT